VFVPRQGGAPCNVAVVASRLGAPTRFLGAIGKDAHGERLMRALREAGVDVSSLITLPNRTGITFVRVGLDGARSFLYYREAGADFALAREHLEALTPSPLIGAHWLQVMSSALVVEPKATASRWVLDQAETAGIPISYDLNVRAHLWTDRERMIDEVRGLAARATLVKASEEDLDAIRLPRTLDALRTLVTRPRAVAILTLAERGAVAAVGDAIVQVPAPVVDVIDATGAGDAFMGTLLAGLVRCDVRPGEPSWARPDAWQAILALACRVGARAVTGMGATDAIRDLDTERRELQGMKP
jgi:fructokinase